MCIEYIVSTRMRQPFCWCVCVCVCVRPYLTNVMNVAVKVVHLRGDCNEVT